MPHPWKYIHIAKHTTRESLTVSHPPSFLYCAQEQPLLRARTKTHENRYNPPSTDIICTAKTHSRTREDVCRNTLTMRLIIAITRGVHKAGDRTASSFTGWTLRCSGEHLAVLQTPINFGPLVKFSKTPIFFISKRMCPSRISTTQIWQKKLILNEFATPCDFGDPC